LFFPGLVILPFSLRYFRAYADFLAGFWFHIACWIIEILFGVTIISSGDVPKNANEAALIISNHRTRLDWMFLWPWILRYGNLQHEKIILKWSLKNVPGFGWAMQKFCFVFLKRKWEQDEAHVSRVLSHFVNQKYPVQLLLFPEGTDLSESNKQRNKEFCEKNNLPMYEHLLYPRTKGWYNTVRMLRPTLNAIYDVSIGFPDYIPQTEHSLFNAMLPKEVHFHLKRYDIKDLPSGEQELSQWCIDRWEEKELRLKNFYAKKKV